MIQFRPRAAHKDALRQTRQEAPNSSTPDDLSRYERRDDAEPDDFRHRMITNAVVFVAAVVLTLIGVWLAMSIADLRKNQDCVLMNRRDCTILPSRGG